MNVEQTSQLIQLVFNSVVMVVACVMVVNGQSLRHVAIVNRLRALQQAYFELAKAERLSSNLSEGRETRLLQLRTQLRQLRQHYRQTHYEVLVAHYALLFCGASTFSVTLRTLLDANWLINAALILFSIGVGLLLVSVGLTLLNLHRSHGSIRQEMGWVLHPATGQAATAKPAAVSRQRSPQKPVNVSAKG